MPRWIIIVNLVGLAVLLLALGFTALLEDDRVASPANTGKVTGASESAVPRGKVAPLLATGPILDFSEPYLRARGDWFRERFAGLRSELSGLELSAVTTNSFTTEVLRAPITDGAWQGSLGPESVERRKADEGQIVEARALFSVPGVKPLDLLVYLMCSDFKAQIPNDPMDRMEHRFPGEGSSGGCLDEPPKLKPTQVLSHEIWEPALLRKGTDIWFINELRREGDCLYFIYRLVKSCQPTDSYTPVRLATGQYAVLPAGSGSIVLLKSYYNGQAIPRFSDFLVRSRTNAFYSGVASFLAKQVSGWKPSERARAWRAKLGVD